MAVFKRMLESRFAKWQTVLASHLNGPFLCTQSVAPVMHRTGGGAGVNMASISALRAR